MSEELDRERQLRERTDDGETIDREKYTQRSRRSFLAFGALGVAGVAGFQYVRNRPGDGNIPDTLRDVLGFNEDVWGLVERDGASARSFSADEVEDLRINGRHGLVDSDGEFIEIPDDEAEAWEIRLTGTDGAGLDPIPLAAIRSEFEVHDMVWEHKCIEGWSNIVQWTGVRFADVIDRFAPDQVDADWAVLRTPTERTPTVDREYSSAVENYTLRHDQTLLAWALNGEPLTAGHGAPIRLVTPFKYGIKQIKRIGSIEFTNGRPTDYWTDRGYDLHSGF